MPPILAQSLRIQDRRPPPGRLQFSFPGDLFAVNNAFCPDHNGILAFHPQHMLQSPAYSIFGLAYVRITDLVGLNTVKARQIRP